MTTTYLEAKLAEARAAKQAQDSDTAIIREQAENIAGLVAAHWKSDKSESNKALMHEALNHLSRIVFALDRIERS